MLVQRFGRMRGKEEEGYQRFRWGEEPAFSEEWVFTEWEGPYYEEPGPPEPQPAMTYEEWEQEMASRGLIHVAKGVGGHVALQEAV